MERTPSLPDAGRLGPHPHRAGPADRPRTRRPAGGIGLGVMALGLALLALLPAHPAPADIAWRMALCGAGFGLFQSPNNHIIYTSGPVHRSGAASGMLGTARLTGQSIGAVLLALVFSVSSIHDGRGPTLALGLAVVFAALAASFSALRLRHGQRTF